MTCWVITLSVSSPLYVFGALLVLPTSLIDSRHPPLTTQSRFGYRTKLLISSLTSRHSAYLRTPRVKRITGICPSKSYHSNSHLPVRLVFASLHPTLCQHPRPSQTPTSLSFLLLPFTPTHDCLLKLPNHS